MSHLQQRYGQRQPPHDSVTFRGATYTIDDYINHAIQQAAIPPDAARRPTKAITPKIPSLNHSKTGHLDAASFNALAKKERDHPAATTYDSRDLWSLSHFYSSYITAYYDVVDAGRGFGTIQMVEASSKAVQEWIRKISVSEEHVERIYPFRSEYVEGALAMYSAVFPDGMNPFYNLHNYVQDVRQFEGYIEQRNGSIESVATALRGERPRVQMPPNDMSVFQLTLNLFEQPDALLKEMEELFSNTLPRVFLDTFERQEFVEGQNWKDELMKNDGPKRLLTTFLYDYLNVAFDVQDSYSVNDQVHVAIQFLFGDDDYLNYDGAVDVQRNQVERLLQSIAEYLVGAVDIFAPAFTKQSLRDTLLYKRLMLKDWISFARHLLGDLVTEVVKLKAAIETRLGEEGGGARRDDEGGFGIEDEGDQGGEPQRKRKAPRDAPLRRLRNPADPVLSFPEGAPIEFEREDKNLHSVSHLKFRSQLKFFKASLSKALGVSEERLAHIAKENSTVVMGDARGAKLYRDAVQAVQSNDVDRKFAKVIYGKLFNTSLRYSIDDFKVEGLKHVVMNHPVYNYDFLKEFLWVIHMEVFNVATHLAFVNKYFGKGFDGYGSWVFRALLSRFQPNSIPTKDDKLLQDILATLDPEYNTEINTFIDDWKGKYNAQHPIDFDDKVFMSQLMFIAARVVHLLEQPEEVRSKYNVMRRYDATLTRINAVGNPASGRFFSQSDNLDSSAEGFLRRSKQDLLFLTYAVYA